MMPIHCTMQAEAKIIPKSGKMVHRTPARASPWGPVRPDFTNNAEQGCLFSTACG
jgi:hypothetical protein